MWCRARPEDAPGFRQSEWMNFLVLHQNRTAHTQGAKNCIVESSLPGFLDLVLWGHEHECIPTPTVTPPPSPSTTTNAKPPYE